MPGHSDCCWEEEAAGANKPSWEKYDVLKLLSFSLKLLRLVKANFPYKKIGHNRFSQQERKELQHRNQHGSQISALELLISICAPIGEKRQIFSFNLI